MLAINGLSVEVGKSLIVRRVWLRLGPGEIHVLMGPNGAGKSTLLKAVMGLRGYRVVEGSVMLDGEDLTRLKPYERVRRGLALAHQTPPKVRVRSSYLIKELMRAYGLLNDSGLVRELINELGLKALMSRELYRGFSGGEVKRFELLTVAMRRPKACLLDEPDSGVDVDSVKVLANVISGLASHGSAVLLVTHTGHIVNYLSRLDGVHVMINGEIVLEGGREVLEEVLSRGYRGIEVA